MERPSSNDELIPAITLRNAESGEGREVRSHGTHEALAGTG